MGLVLLVTSGCGTSVDRRAVAETHVPHVAEVGSRIRTFSSLSEVAGVSNALVEAMPTGRQRSVPLPPEQAGSDQSAPTVFIEMRVAKVLSGAVDGDIIQVVSPGTETTNNEPVLLVGGPFLMYLTPAVYDVNSPTGGYAVTGGPAGLYAADGNRYTRIDDLSDKLPLHLDPRGTRLPTAARSEKDLFRTGGF